MKAYNKIYFDPKPSDNILPKRIEVVSEDGFVIAIIGCDQAIQFFNMKYACIHPQQLMQIHACATDFMHYYDNLMRHVELNKQAAPQAPTPKEEEPERWYREYWFKNKTLHIRLFSNGDIVVVGDSSASFNEGRVKISGSQFEVTRLIMDIERICECKIEQEPDGKKFIADIREVHKKLFSDAANTDPLSNLTPEPIASTPSPATPTNTKVEITLSKDLIAIIDNHGGVLKITTVGYESWAQKYNLKLMTEAEMIQYVQNIENLISIKKNNPNQWEALITSIKTYYKNQTISNEQA